MRKDAVSNADLIKRLEAEIDKFIYSMPSRMIDAIDDIYDALDAADKRIEELEETLRVTRRVLEIANNDGTISDTLWSGSAETLFDYIDYTLKCEQEGSGKC